MKYDEGVSERVRALRKELKMSRREFAEPLRVSTGVVQNVEEKRTSNVSEIFLRSICREYNVNYEWLLTGKGERHPPSVPVPDVAKQILEEHNAQTTDAVTKKVIKLLLDMPPEFWNSISDAVSRIERAAVEKYIADSGPNSRD